LNESPFLGSTFSRAARGVILLAEYVASTSRFGKGTGG
jgi:hypothetical protein